MWRTTLESPQATFEVGRRIGRAAAAGDVVALSGELGAGKTLLAKGVAEGLGTPGLVTSPTFVIMSLHAGGRLPLVHADLYRLSGADELIELGLEEQLVGSLAVIEWADRFPSVLPPDHLVVDLTWLSSDVRSLAAYGHGTASTRLLEWIRV